MKIAIVKLSALGDIIHASIVLQFIKKHRPKAKIDWLVDARFAKLLEDEPLINEVFALPIKDKEYKKTLGMILEARQNAYDLVIDLQGLIKSAVISRMLGKNVFGFDKGCVREGLATLFYRFKLSIAYDENIIVRNLALAAFGINESFDESDIISKIDCFTTDSAGIDELKDSLDIQDGCILIHVGSSVANKIYPVQRMAFLAENLLKKYPYKILLCWGSKSEFDFAKQLINSAKLEYENIALAPKLGLSELKNLTKCARLVIGNDSGPTHLAFALNIPSICIFGATPSYRNAYVTKINKVIDTGKKISAFKLDKNDFCIREIDEDDIFALACKLLG